MGNITRRQALLGLGALSVTPLVGKAAGTTSVIKTSEPPNDTILQRVTVILGDMNSEQNLPQIKAWMFSKPFMRVPIGTIRSEQYDDFVLFIKDEESIKFVKNSKLFDSTNRYSFLTQKFSVTQFSVADDLLADASMEVWNLDAYMNNIICFNNGIIVSFILCDVKYEMLKLKRETI